VTVPTPREARVLFDQAVKYLQDNGPEEILGCL
jgi:hypothetical protein